MKARAQLLLIALLIIIILLGEAAVRVPTPAGGSVVIKSYPSTTSLVQALTSGQVTVAPLDDVAPQVLAQLRNNPALSIIPIGNFGFTYIGFNLRNPPLNDSIFRQAMLYGFDRSRVVSDVLSGYGQTLNSGLFSSAYAALGWQNDSVDSYPYNPQKASQLLDSIGFTESSDRVRIDPSTGQQLRTMFIFSKLTDPQAVAAANLFADNMQAIGLPVISFPETPFDYYSQTYVTYYFDLYIQTISSTAAPTWLYNLFAGSNDVSPAPLSANLVGYRSAEFDACAEQLMTANNLDSAKTAALTCQGQLSADLPALPVYSKNLLLVEQKGTLNITPIAGSVTATLAASLANMASGNTVTIGEVGGLDDVNPALNLSPADELILNLMTSPILTYTSSGLAAQGLADQWQMSDNNTVLTLSIRNGSEFQDGTPITAHDLAATLKWIQSNMIPSTPLYSTLHTVTGVGQMSGNAIQITFSQPNYFAPYEIAGLFALPANLLPSSGGSLSLLLNGALESSGQFSLVRFVQGSEADLELSTQGSEAEISGVRGQPAFAFSIGGSQIQIVSEPLTYDGQSIENATFTARIGGSNGSAVFHGSYLGFGIYSASLNMNDQDLQDGNHRVNTELYGLLPSGVILQFGERNLQVYPPLLLLQVAVYILGIVAIAVAANSRKRVTRRVRGRGAVRPPHGRRVSRARKRTKFLK